MVEGAENDTKKIEDASPGGPSDAIPPITQIVSNARGPYPQLEMFSVPHKQYTYPGPSNRRNVGASNQTVADGVEARAVQRITKRLADVRIPEISYTSLLTCYATDGFHR